MHYAPKSAVHAFVSEPMSRAHKEHQNGAKLSVGPTTGPPFVLLPVLFPEDVLFVRAEHAPGQSSDDAASV